MQAVTLEESMEKAEAEIAKSAERISVLEAECSDLQRALVDERRGRAEVTNCRC